MIELTKRTKIATGASRVVDWQQHGSGSGVLVDVDTSPAGFTKTPTYITSIHGMGAHWRTTGGNAVYNASPKGFRVYIQYLEQQPLTTETAKRHGWHIQWIGIED
jgi:hypothetical protein